MTTITNLNDLKTQIKNTVDLKAYLERKMSQANNAEVTIGSLDLDYFERYITLKDVKIMSNLNEEEAFISIDKFKTIYIFFKYF